MELGALSIRLAVRHIEASRRFYEKSGFTIMIGEAHESTTRPASFIAVDPDGNPLLFDQHL